MHKIEIIETGEGGGREWMDVRTFPAPSGRTAVFYDSREFHMGASDWRLRIEQDGMDITPAELAAGRFICPGSCQPWSCDSDRVLLGTWKSRYFLFDLAESRAIDLKLEGYPIGILGSLEAPHFLAITAKSNYLLSSSGEILVGFGVKSPPHGHAELGWVDSAKQFFSLEYVGPGQSTFVFRNINPVEVVATSNFDPIEIFPYEEAKYSLLNRDAYSLYISAGIQSVASLLDCWRFEFDQRHATFKASVYRPEGDIFQKGNQTMCRVKDHWVKAKFVI